MRDMKRIARILTLISKIWYKHPDLRLCQIIMNAVQTDLSLYYIEDDYLEDHLEQLYERIKDECL